MARILFLNLPYVGHVTPTLGLVSEFVKRGHEVGYILNSEWRKEIEYRGAKFIEYVGYKGNPMVLRNCYYALYNTAISVASDYDCIVYEMFFILGRRLADKLNKPSVRIFSTFALNHTVLKELVSQKGSILRIFSSKAVRRFETRFQVRSLDLEVNDFFDEIGCDEQKINIVYTSKKFQVYEEQFNEDNYFFVGSSANAKINEENSCLPTVYISLGTLFNNNVKFYNKCIEAFRGEKVQVYMSVGEKINVSKFKNIPNNIKIYNYVPQIEILGRASLFITHGGMNSVNESMKLGVPMLVFPMNADQPYVAKRIHDLNLGISCSLKGLTSKKIKELAFHVMNDTNITKSIQLMKEDMMNYYGNKEAADIILKYIIKT